MKILHYPKDRDPSFDAFRGLAIIAVVAIHAIPWRCYWDFRILVYRQLLDFAVPAFIFISGYWSSKKPLQSLEDYKTFLMRRLSRVLTPYLFWSFIFLGHTAIKNDDINVQKMVFKLLAGGASYHFYFIIMIAQFYMMTPILQYISRRRYGNELIFVLNIVYLSFLYNLRLHNHWLAEYPYYLVHTPFLGWTVFYQIGLWVGNNDNKILISKNERLFILPAILVSLLLAGIESINILSKYNNLDLAVCVLKYSSFLYSICIILGFILIREYFKYWPKFLTTIGNYSFGIYLIHTIILNRIVNIIPKTSIISSFQPLYELTVILMTISICLVVIGITRKFLPRPIYSKILGF